MWKRIIQRTRKRLVSGGWIANLVVGVVLLLLTPVFNSTMNSPKAAIVSFAVGLTVLVWVVAGAMIISLPEDTAIAPGLSAVPESDSADSATQGGLGQSSGDNAAQPAPSNTGARGPEPKPLEPPAENSPSTSPASQTIINSPGAMQAGRDIIISADPKLIRSIELRISVEASTQKSPPGPEQYDFGLGSVVALFTSANERIRFVSDAKVYDQQISETRRRVRFVYQPEDPATIQGRPVEVLGMVRVLAFNFSEIFKTIGFDANGAETIIECGVVLNGIPMMNIKTPTDANASLNERQANMSVADGFGRIPSAYSEILAKARTP